MPESQPHRWLFFGLNLPAFPQFNSLEVFYFACLQGKTQKGFHEMKPMVAGSAWVEVEHVIKRRIAFHPQDVRMTTDEDVGWLGKQDFAYLRIVVGWGSANVRHPYRKALTHKSLVFRVARAQRQVVNVAIHRPKGFEMFQIIGHLSVTNIASMPDFIAFAEVGEDLRIKKSVGVRQKTDAYHGR